MVRSPASSLAALGLILSGIDPPTPGLTNYGRRLTRPERRRLEEFAMDPCLTCSERGKIPRPSKTGRTKQRWTKCPTCNGRRKVPSPRRSLLPLDPDVVSSERLDSAGGIEEQLKQFLEPGELIVEQGAPEDGVPDPKELPKGARAIVVMDELRLVRWFIVAQGECDA